MQDVMVIRRPVHDVLTVALHLGSVKNSGLIDHSDVRPSLFFCVAVNLRARERLTGPVA